MINKLRYSVTIDEGMKRDINLVYAAELQKNPDKYRFKTELMRDLMQCGLKVWREQKAAAKGRRHANN